MVGLRLLFAPKKLPNMTLVREVLLLPTYRDCLQLNTPGMLSMSFGLLLDCAFGGFPPHLPFRL